MKDTDYKHYVYIFVRQDLSNEQQAVQAAHATMQMGVESQRRGPRDEFIPHQTGVDVHPKKTYFTLVGVRNLEALEGVASILEKFNIRHETFIEPDIAPPSGEPTAIATYPIREDLRGPLLAFNLLKMNK